MVVILKHGTVLEDIQELKGWLESQGVEVWPSEGSEVHILGLVGNTVVVDRSRLEANEHVERVVNIAEPYKRVNRKFHPENTIVKVGSACIGGNRLAVIAGPCSVESEDQIKGIASEVKQSGALCLRGGAFKPRTSPYAFQGLQYEGLELLKHARETTGMPIVTEIMSINDIDVFEENVDIIQVGARNMQNFDLLRALGTVSRPVLLKRGPSATIEDWLMAAEYIMAGGNEQVILCERGIKTFENYTRNTLDLSAVPIAKKLTHLPVVVDPSHGTGKNWLVPSLALAAVAAGADGLMVEVHNDPPRALSDGQQSIRPSEFSELMNRVRIVAGAMGRTV